METIDRQRNEKGGVEASRRHHVLCPGPDGQEPTCHHGVSGQNLQGVALPAGRYRGVYPGLRRPKENLFFKMYYISC